LGGIAPSGGAGDSITRWMDGHGGPHLASLTSKRNVLLLHDGELADIRGLLGQLGSPPWETLDGEVPSSWDLALATPRHLVELSSLGGRKSSLHRIAVVEHDSRTLRALVQRCGIDQLVRRPVHPTALRLLLKHAIYGGRARCRPRIAVGAPVHMRVGLKRAEGILADLSLDGCRVLTEVAVPQDQRLMIAPPREGGGRGWFLCGQAVREIEEPDFSGTSVGVRFQWLLPGSRKRLERMVEFYQRGPATLSVPVRSPLVDTPAVRHGVSGLEAVGATGVQAEILLTEVVEEAGANAALAKRIARASREES